MASPSSPSGESSVSNPRQQTDESGQARKRARDRKAQQAMRDRAKYTLQSLERQVVLLTQTLQQETHERVQMVARIQMLEKENEQLRMLNAPLHLDLLGDAAIMHGSLATPARVPRPLTGISPHPPWKTLPLSTAPTCTSDQILQAFLRSRQPLSVGSELGEAVRRPLVFSKKPSLCSLLSKDLRSTDETSNIVSDIIGSYSEINSLPKQVATHFMMSLYIKWMLLQDEESFNDLPVWLRPLTIQTTTPHAYWIDRLPWPESRAYMIKHPEVKFDDFVIVYSTNFDISWDYDPKHVLISCDSDHPDDLCISPIFEEHIRKLKSWTVSEVLRFRFPGILGPSNSFE